jgi:hypothetical protein
MLKHPLGHGVLTLERAITTADNCYLVPGVHHADDELKGSRHGWVGNNRSVNPLSHILMDDTVKVKSDKVSHDSALTMAIKSLSFLCSWSGSS